MSIHGNVEVYPGGSRLAATDLVNFSIVSTPDDQGHSYRFTFRDGSTVTGTIPKKYSGHGHILHLLRDCIDDIDLESLGPHYSSVRTKGQQERYDDSKG